jgi:hypothetical protein
MVVRQDFYRPATFLRLKCARVAQRGWLLLFVRDERQEVFRLNLRRDFSIQIAPVLLISFLWRRSVTCAKTAPRAGAGRA